jgi:uncharacterized protein (TIGR03000 family)
MDAARPLLALPLVLLIAAPAVAQKITPFAGGLVSAPSFVGPAPNWHHDCGPGVGWSYYGVQNGPTTTFSDLRAGRFTWGWAGVLTFGGLPHRWYGGPVPNYTPVPAMGGCDRHRRYMTPPARGYGLNVFSYRSAVARLCTPSVSVWPAAASSASGGCARLEVRVPHPTAEVWVNRQPTAATGTERAFETPELAAGKEFGYEVVARWEENGEKRAVTRMVTVTAGNTQLVDFTNR